MPGPIDTKFNQIQSDQTQSDQSVGDDYDPGWGEDPYAGIDDIVGNPEDGFGEDFGVSGDPFSGGSGIPAAPTDPDAFHAWLRDLKNSGQITETQFDQYSAQVESTFALSTAGQQQALADLANSIHASFAQEIVDTQEETQTQGAEDVKTELEDLKKDIDDAENLTEDEKIQLSAQVDTILNDMELHPEDVNPDSIRADIEDIRSQLEESNQFSPALKGLADQAGVEIEVLSAKAEAAGIDLTDLPLPPPMNVLEFLKEEIPGLKEKFDAVEDAVNDRQISIEKHQGNIKDINDHNTSGDDSNNNDIKDPADWQALFDLRYHQSQEDDAVKNAMEEAVNALTPILEALYPGQDVKAVEPESASGWKRNYNEFMVAGQVEIGGTKVDFFDNTTGELQSSTTMDETPEIQIDPIKWDGEGDGAWDGRAVMKQVDMYAEEDTVTDRTYASEYDNGSEDDF